MLEIEHQNQLSATSYRCRQYVSILWIIHEILYQRLPSMHHRFRKRPMKLLLKGEGQAWWPAQLFLLSSLNLFQNLLRPDREEQSRGAQPNGAEGRRHQNWRGHRRPTAACNPPSLILSRVVGKIESGVIDFIRKLIQGVTANLIPLFLVRQNIPESDSTMSPHPVKGYLPLIE